MNNVTLAPVVANGRQYPWPKVPAIAICLDGCEPAREIDRCKPP